MSSRALRRLQKEQLSIVEKNSSDDESDGYEPPSKAQNLFDLLNEDGNSDEEEQEESQDESTTVNSKDQHLTKTSTQATHKSTPSPPTSNSNKSKKNKKNKKKQQKKAAKMANTNVSELSLQELDDMLDNLKTTDNSGSTTGTSCATKNTNESNDPETTLTHTSRQLLTVNYKYLDSEAEMKRMFGSRVVNREARPSGRLLKKTKLATPKLDWPSFQKQGLTMEHLDSGVSHYAFKHQETYQDTQLNYLNVIAQHDPNGLVMLTHQHPYHVDSLLQLSEIAKQQGDWTVAGDCIDRALYASERAFHPHFNLGSGNVRLPYQRSENRSFFIAVVRHIQFLTRRGCWRTAFEFNKLLLSLSPFSDPTGALLSLDYYALSARDYRYVLNFGKDWKPDGETYPKDMLILPNFAFSTAYAKFKHHQQGHTDDDNDDIDDDDVDGSIMLCNAIARFPGFVPGLLEALDESDSTINQQLSFFTKTTTDDHLSLLLALYIDRIHELWKEPEVLSWLKANTYKVLKDSTFHNKALVGIPHTKGQDSSLPLNLCRHVLLLERRELLSMLPRSVTNATSFANDPLPPSDSTTGYDIEERIRNTNQRNGSNVQNGFLTALQNLMRFEQLDPGERQRIRQAINDMTGGDRIPGAFPGLYDGDGDDDDNEVTVAATADVDDDTGEGEVTSSTDHLESVDRQEWQRIIDMYGGSGDAQDDRRTREILGFIGDSEQQDGDDGDMTDDGEDYLDDEDLELQRTLMESAQQHHDQMSRRDQE
ncbi:transcriptional repressor TCF25-domain-containing protein [Chlamydoabsidia padenii]|nr:transcriptional repressor TCF25-domain-containing protein [Chlamydoabsidia padenii]